MPILTRSAAAILACVLTASAARAALVGRWQFNDRAPLADATGHFSALVLKGDATVGQGALHVTGAGTLATGWAVTSGGYTGPTISDKTLVSWLTLEGLADVASAGSAITLDRISGDQFDAIVFSELALNRWMAGSTIYLRTQPFVPGFEETATGSLIQMAITYRDVGGGQMEVTGYRDGVQIGQYLTGNQATWTAGDAEVFFGVRHGSEALGGPGALSASIAEARIYDEALTADEIRNLRIDAEPAPAPLLPGPIWLGVLLLTLYWVGWRRMAR